MRGNEIIYQIFVRNYSNDGTFKSIEHDLERIKDLGVDIIYLMPIHEIGVLERKGTWGSPYAIKDYFSITPDYGTKEDFISLIESTHRLGMKLILDMVFNHTSPDNVLVDTHPEYYFYKNGRRGNRVGDWSDIVDLDTYKEEVQDYLISVLKYWVSLGVDCFRIDVASMIPLEFFKKARKELGEDIIFIGESISIEFSDYLRSQGENATPDRDMFPTFDSLYNYSWFRRLENYLKGWEPIDSLVDALNRNEEDIGQIGIRMNCLENHDNERINSVVKPECLKSIVDFISYIKGQMFIYAGQEYGNCHKPELFEKDPVMWYVNEDVEEIYKEAINYKKQMKNTANLVQKFEKCSEHSIRVNNFIDNQLVDSRVFEF